MREKGVGKMRMGRFLVLCGMVVFISTGFRTGVYAVQAGTDNLRPKGAVESRNDASIKDDVVEKMRDGGAAAVTGIAPILFTDNTATLLTGAHTGLRNFQAAANDGTDGELFNHSEKRGRLEEQIKDKLGNLVGQPGMSVEAIKKQWVNDLKNMGLREDEIKATLQWLENFVSSYSTLTRMYQATRQDRTDELSKLAQRMAAEKERMARRVVNKIINAELKRLIDFEKNGFIPAGDGKFTKYVSKQNVLCVGETIDQKNAGATNTVIQEDLTEILEGISLEDILSIRLRIAYEPRWMIGLPKGQIPGIDVLKPLIENNHRFIKKIIHDLYGFEIAVDYGGSLNKDNVEILRLEPVNGGLIGGAGKTDTGISPVLAGAISIAVEEGKLITLGLNWKAETGETGLVTLDRFAEMFKGLDLTKVQVTLHSNQVRTVKERLAGVSTARGVILPANYIDMARDLKITQLQLADYLRASQDSYYRLAAGNSFEQDFLKKIVKLLESGKLTSGSPMILAFSTDVASASEFGELMQVLSGLRKLKVAGAEKEIFRVALYGKNAANIQALGKDVITADDKIALLPKLEAMNIDNKDVRIVLSGEDSDVIGVKRLVSGENLLLATAKAIQSAVIERTESGETITAVNEALRKYYTKLMEAGIISKQTYAANEKIVEATVDINAAFNELPAIKMEETKSKELAANTIQTTNFMTERGV